MADPRIGIAAGFTSDVSPRLLEHPIAGGRSDASVNAHIRVLAEVPFGQCHADEDVIDPAIEAEVPIKAWSGKPALRFPDDPFPRIR